MILIALGANLLTNFSSSPRDSCIRAMTQLRELQCLSFVSVSHWYRTLPVPRDESQPDYCNGVARFTGNPAPETLLAALHGIEAAFGRERGVVNAARTLDLDLIALNGLVRADTPPILPHPRAHLRRFVLRPLLDVAPDWVHPASGETAAALLAALTDQSDDPIGPW